MGNEGDWSVMGQSFYMLLLLALMLVILFVAVRFLKHRRPGQCGSFKIISVCQVAQQASLMVVQVGNRFVLLGVTRDSINMLADVSDEKDQFSAKQTDAALFNGILNRIMRRGDEHDSAGQ
jgi:flagellar biogenesis protein FliO